MNKEHLIAAGIDYDEGLARFLDDYELYEKGLLLFAGSDKTALLGKALDAGDTKEAFFIAHSLKGESGNLSINIFYNDIKPLVELLRADRTDGTRELFEKVKNDFTAASGTILSEKKSDDIK